MNVTWLIGNGFDLACGLKTSYPDFYKSTYVQNNTTNQIYQDINANMESWTDFEVALGELSYKIFNHVIDKQHFIFDVTQVYSDLGKYLEIQQERNTLTDGNIEKFKEYLIHFYNYVDPAHKKLIWDQLYNQQSPRKFGHSFVVFNYTNTFSRFLEQINADIPINNNAKAVIRKSDICFIHGSLEKGIIVGCDNQSQYNFELLGTSSYLLDKSITNNERGTLNIENAVRLIKSTNLFVIFGMSLGETDQRWWNEIASRVISNPANRIVIFNYIGAIEGNDNYIKVAKSHEIKQKFIDSLGDDFTSEQIEDIRQKIIVSNRHDMFDLKSKTPSTVQ